ncbi:MAG TPA: agmatinase [Bacteriovoracaceae bacterium]|nr:agmatinase [Bacteriovoracaceae bacterium]
MEPKLLREVEGLEQSKAFIATEFSQAIYSNTTHIIGFCFDGTTSFRPGARFGASALREASFGLEDFSPYLEKDLTDYHVVTMGDLPIYPSKWHLTNDFFKEMVQGLDFKKEQIKFLTIGGEHSISYGPIVKYLESYPDLVVLHLDAHTDLRDGYLEEKYSHASIIRRVLDHFTQANRLIQYGIRSGPREEFKWMKENKTLAGSLKECCEWLEAIDDSRPIYLTLDFDFFDPAFFPGTGTPEAGGEDFHGFMRILKILNRKNFVGADVVELAPMLDPTNNSACFASKVTREVILAMNR